MFKRYTYTEGLTSLVDSGGNFYINIYGKVLDKWGRDVPVKVNDENDLVVEVLSWDGQREYRVLDLMVAQYKDLHIPKRNYNDMVAFPVDGDKNNVHANNVGYRFKEKIEVRNFPGFYHIPAFTRSAISEDGRLLNVSKQKIIDWYVTKPQEFKNIKGGYRTYKYYSNGKSYEMGRHRAMMLTFKEYPNNCDILIVNHINGIPGDDRLENLEWMTRGQNNVHAYENDLKNQNKRVLCRDVLSGEIVEYYSISECARKLGYPTDETIRQRLITSPFCKVFQDGKQLKYKDDSRDWLIPEDPVKAVEEAKEFVEVIARNCETLEEQSYSTMTDAYRATGINHSSIALRIKIDDRSPLFGYQFKKSSDARPFPAFTKEQYLTSLKPNSFKVNARNLLTKEENVFDSVNTAARTLGNLNIPYVLRRGEQPLSPDGWQLKFENQEWEEIKDLEEELYKRTKEVMARNELTGEVILAESSRQMCEAIQEKDYKAIRTAALTRGNKVWRGYRFRLGISDEPWPTT